MSELTFEQMLDASLKTIHAGEVVEGTVIDVKPEEAVLNIGCKSDGILTRNEYSNDSNLDLTTVVKPGDTMEVKVLKVNDGEGQVLLTYKRLAADRGNKRIEEAFNNHEVLKAKVTQVLDGGLIVVVDEVRIFIPASLVSDTYEKDLTKYADQEIEFVISEYNPKRRRYIGDRKQLIVAKKAEQQAALFARIHEGDVVEGVVKNVTDFGAFVDLGGADGLLGQIVVGRTQAACGENDVGPVPGNVQSLPQALRVVPHYRVPEDVDAQGGQALREHLGVGVGDVTQQDLCADCDKFCVQ